MNLNLGRIANVKVRFLRWILSSSPRDSSSKMTSNILSVPGEELCLVDQHDELTGTMSKESCHVGLGRRHRAFSLHILNSREEFLIHRRSESKMLWPGFWSNSCCSHPRKGETMIEAVNRRLYDELGLIEFSLKYIYQFSYVAKYKNIGTENELCSVYMGKIDSELNVNLNEIADSKFISKKELDKLLRVEEKTTPWFLMEWEKLNLEYSLELENFIT